MSVKKKAQETDTADRWLRRHQGTGSTHGLRWDWWQQIEYDREVHFLALFSVLSRRHHDENDSKTEARVLTLQGHW